MTDHEQQRDWRIVEDYFDVWLDDRADAAPDDVSQVGTPPGEVADDLSLSRLLSRTSRCAELIASVWPRLEHEPGLRSTITVSPELAKESGAFRPVSIAEGTLHWAAPVQLGRFLIEEEIGRGRFGIVYRARDPRLQRDVAIKVARPEVSSHPALTNRFLREAASVARLEHPGIVPVHEAGETDQCLYYVMPYCHGEDLARWLERNPGPVDQRLAAELIRQIAEATHYGHTQGIIHRDLKPANILLVSTVDRSAEAAAPFQARILDFGLSRSIDWDLHETRSSMILGTPLYMSPEQAQQNDAQVGPASDIFALGCILYELLVGDPPFLGSGFLEILERLRDCQPAALHERRPDVARPLEQICLKCLRLYPEDRYASVQELAGDLQRFLNDDPIQAQRASWFDHLRWWARKPQRIADAGRVLLVVNLVLALSTLVNTLAPMLATEGPLETFRVAELWRSHSPAMRSMLS